jgi:polyketide cyclase/dehydrase/lipid transport protein
MKLLLSIVIALGGLGAIVALIGSRLPKAHHAARSARFPVPPDALYAIINDVDRYPEWRKDVKRIERLPDRDGRPAWIEHGSHGAIPMRSERAEPPSLMVGRIGEGLAFGGTWTFRIVPAAGGSELTVTEDGEIYNPIFRFLARFVFGYEATMKTYLAALQARVATTAPRART